MTWWSGVFPSCSCPCSMYLTSWPETCDLSRRASSACLSWLTHSVSLQMSHCRSGTSASLRGPDTQGRLSGPWAKSGPPANICCVEPCIMLRQKSLGRLFFFLIFATTRPSGLRQCKMLMKWCENGTKWPVLYIRCVRFSQLRFKNIKKGYQTTCCLWHFFFSRSCRSWTYAPVGRHFQFAQRV